MKTLILAAAIITASLCCKAQTQLTFPFQGGKDVMNQFFKDSTVVSAEIIQKRATGTVLFKFTADELGEIKKFVIYFADDALLISPVIDAIKKSNHKWIIPNHRKTYDFIIPFIISFNAATADPKIARPKLYNFYKNKQPILSSDQVPLTEATLLPAVQITY